MSPSITSPLPPPLLRSRMAGPPAAERVPGRAARDAADRAHVERARREGTPAARAAAVEAFMPLVRSLARRYQRGEEPLDDLEQVASLGLLKAIDGFDLERGTAFASFAVPTIVGELRRHFRDKGWTIRVPRDLQQLSLRVNKMQEQVTSELGRPPTVAELAGRLDVPVERVLEAREARHAMRPVSLDRPALSEGEEDSDTIGDRFGVIDANYRRAEDSVTVSELLGRLPERERIVVMLRFDEDLTQSEIGERIGISQMHVSRLLRRALGELGQMADDDATHARRATSTAAATRRFGGG